MGLSLCSSVQHLLFGNRYIKYRSVHVVRAFNYSRVSKPLRIERSALWDNHFVHKLAVSVQHYKNYNRPSCWRMERVLTSIFGPLRPCKSHGYRMKGKHTAEKESLAEREFLPCATWRQQQVEVGSKRSSTQPRKHATCMEAPFHCLRNMLLHLGFQVFFNFVCHLIFPAIQRQF